MPIFIGALLIVATGLGVLVYRTLLHRLDVRYGRSCANHFNHHQLGLTMAANDHPDQILLATNDARAALLILDPQFDHPPGWLTNSWSACPESFIRDGSFGCVYVGDGLMLGDVVDRGILILFCANENHRGSWDVARGCFTKDGFTSTSNAGLIAELERAIARGESGEVAYSERAMKVLRSELEKRRKPVR